ncbi:hypothetical protein PCANC_27477 [Puccinia coronata f. sp. avenae]|uniref:Uncharacterized protein n=1 Tax=Puccinia coronata f. sp. avenae TaxID=200324 RepID=A0A2N5TVY7_9BASI|nr:hypothetical protein PCANC_27477 [Puccinia coronata f. sp. avenae]
MVPTVLFPPPPPSLHERLSTTRPSTPEPALSDSHKQPANALVSSKLGVTPTKLISRAVSELDSACARSTTPTTFPVAPPTTSSVNPLATVAAAPDCSANRMEVSDIITTTTTTSSPSSCRF